MYLFPRFEFPRSFLQASENPEDDYCLQLLEETGICLVPGWGFGEAPGTHHLRCTFLVPDIEAFGRRLTDFHLLFLDRCKA